MKYFRSVVMLAVIACAFNSPVTGQINSSDSAQGRNAVADSLMRNIGLAMPELPDSFPTSADFLNVGRCWYAFAYSLTSDTTAYRDKCFIMRRNSTKSYFRLRVIGLTNDREKKVLLAVFGVVVRGDSHAYCGAYLNSGVWREEPGDKFENLDGECNINERNVFIDPQLNRRVKDFFKKLDMVISRQ